MTLKKKYTSRAEPRSWYNIAGKKNTPQYGSGSSINSKRKVQKGSDHPIGMSGRTLSSSKKG